MKTSSPNVPLLRGLRSDFAAFRGRSRPRGRIPDDLRRRVLSAIASGIEPSVMTFELGVSSPQIARWRGQLMPALTCGIEPRTLDVIADTPKTAEPSGLRVSYEAGRLVLELSF